MEEINMRESDILLFGEFGEEEVNKMLDDANMKDFADETIGRILSAAMTDEGTISTEELFLGIKKAILAAIIEVKRAYEDTEENS